MDNNSSMLQLCRLCLVKDDVNIPIFEEQGDIRQIFLKISSCLPVKLSRDDRLPKKICDGCSYKLDMLYEFWNTSANAEKQLLTWLGEAGMTSKMTDGTISAVAQQIKPADAFVKQETIDPPDIRHEDDHDDKNFVYNEKHEENARNNADEPPPKRARRTAAVKAAIAMDQDSDDDDDSGEPMTKMEDDSEDSDNDDQEPSFADVPSTSADDQPGPSGVNKDGVEAPCWKSTNCPQSLFENLRNLDVLFHKVLYCSKCTDLYTIDHKCSRSNIQCAFCKKSLENVDIVKHQCFRHLLNKIESDDARSEIKGKLKRKPPRQNQSTNTRRKNRCRDCNIKFESRNSYRKHRYQEHNEEKYKICTLCGKSIVSLSQHLKGVHGNPDSFKCSKCDKSFSCKKHLQRHMLVHSDSYNHVCTTCGKGFKTSFSMRVHMRSHDEVKPFECPVCSKTFTTKQWRDNHMKTHR
ncbi:unnamed protein product [Phyllotreta striolata]|uniref:Uncharacterized protein n=1 Tax=Phyllotreta striolata TaxID=444603 RepID=A0A9N9XL79_PHYSR|nr:unnamed protein product [Phyllotreta striolata]